MRTLRSIECEAFAGVFGANANSPRHQILLQRVLDHMALPSQHPRLQSLGGRGLVGLLMDSEEEPKAELHGDESDLLLIIGGIEKERRAERHVAPHVEPQLSAEDEESLYEIWRTTRRRYQKPEEAAWLLVDLRNHKVLLAEDKHGTRPLYIRQYEDVLYVSTSGMALRELGASAINSAYIYDCLVQSFRSLEFFWQGIDLVGAGRGKEYVISDMPQALSARSHPALGSHGDHRAGASTAPAREALDIEPLLEKLYRSLCAALERRLPRRGPVEIFLSEGIDSNMLVSIAVKEFGREVVGYTWRHPGESRPLPELPVPVEKKLARVFVTLDGMGLWEAAETACKATGAILPFLQGGVRLLLDQQVKGEARLVFTGDGADEYFFGYPYMSTTRDEPDIRDPFAVSWVGKAPRNEANPRSRFIASLHERFQNICSEQFYESAGPTRHSQSIEGSTDEVLHAQVAWDREAVLSNYFLRYLGYELDRMAQVSSTPPYLDEGVTDIAEDVTPRVHMLDGTGKYLLRAMARKYNLLTETQLAEKKKGFVFAPIGQDWIDYPVVQDRINPRAIADRGIFKPEAVSELIEMVRSAKHGVLDQMMLVSIWSAQVLAEQGE